MEVWNKTERLIIRWEWDDDWHIFVADVGSVFVFSQCIYSAVTLFVEESVVY